MVYFDWVMELHFRSFPCESLSRSSMFNIVVSLRCLVIRRDNLMRAVLFGMMLSYRTERPTCRP